MLNAVDINQFLAQEQSQMQDVSIDQLIVQTMAGISGADSHLLAQKQVDRRIGLYCLGVRKESIGLFDSGSGKKYLFEFDVQSNMVSMNQRRAQSKEIKFFSHRLNQLAQIGRSVAHLIGVHSDSSDQSLAVLPDPLLKKLTGIFHFKLPLQWVDVSSNQFNQLAWLFNQVVKKFHVTIVQGDDSDKMDQLFSYVEELIASQALSDEDCVMVSNQSGVNHATNVVYSMYIYSALVVIVTEKGPDKSIIEIDIKQKKASLDKAELKANAVDWLLKKCQKISADISSGVASIYESVN
ncbi:hypothetical protein DID73_00565 [Candidatus Marinamargulisbacteria bacterium SCGC AG-343-K17]|nr:hypothetical protein DID73_00565 [Candidatus Marinamargulisbacteria bacterium SCGC AG-343-K17]